jgi:anti-sigma regulatory factor (Ser/Thr protein kinase)
MHKVEHHLVVQAHMSEMPRVLEFITIHARKAGMDDRGVYHCQLAVDEVCANVMEHAYRDGRKHRPIYLTTSAQIGLLTIIVADEGPPFDPLTQPSPDPATTFTRDKPGGWGIHLVRRVMDEVAYRYADGRNILTLYKEIPPD